MYQISELYTGLIPLIGWRQPPKTGLPTIDSTNLGSTSGMYFQDFNSLVTVENVWQCQNDETISVANFNTYLANLEKSAINKVIRAVFTSDDIIENRVLYPEETELTDTLTNATDFVGFEIEVYRRKDIAAIINNAFVAFDGVDTVKLLLFHSSQDALLDSQEVTTVANSEKNQALNWVLQSMKYGGGKYYIGYLRSGLTASAINREDSAENCFNLCKIRSIQVPSWNAETLFDIDDIDYTSETWGLNFDVSTLRDYTNLILSNKNKLVNAIGLQMAADVLEMIVNSTRSNRVERTLSAQAKLEREGNLLNETDIPKSVGIMRQLESEIKQLRKTLFDEPIIRRVTLG